MFSECWAGCRTGFGWGPGWGPFLPTCLVAAACDFRQVTLPLPSWIFLVCKLWVMQTQRIKGAKNVCVGTQCPARKGQVAMLRLVMTSAVTGSDLSQFSISVGRGDECDEDSVLLEACGPTAGKTSTLFVLMQDTNGINAQVLIFRGGRVGDKRASVY